MTKKRDILFYISFMAIFMAMGLLPASAGQTKVAYLHNLSNFTGTVPFYLGKLSPDPYTKEMYVLDLREKDIRIFDENGMEIYIFGENRTLGNPVDLAVDEEGDIFVLSRGPSKSVIIRCDFRGEPISQIHLENLPPEFSRFRPDSMIYKEGRFFLAEKDALLVAVTDKEGVFQKAYELAPLLGLEEKKRNETSMFGFTVDTEGRLLFTIPTLFSVCRISSEGEIESFGISGSRPGSFGIVSGIASDEKGFYYVSDKLRNVVMIFDNDFQFVQEFGYRGFQPQNLIVPTEVAFSKEMLFVSQMGNRGVSVFQIRRN